MASPTRVNKRVRVTLKPKSCPNPLFEKWLQEMKDEAAMKESKTQYAYAKALKSLQLYPLKLHSTKECKVLKHFGEVMCQQLEKRLQQYLAEGGTLESEDDYSPDESPPAKRVSKKSSNISPTNGGTLANEKRKSVIEYIPQRRSGAYALLLALLKHSGTAGFLRKTELQDAAQPYADVSFTQGSILNSEYYTAWSSMTTLIKKQLVEKAGSPARYMLTNSGRSLAITLDRAESGLHNSPPGSHNLQSNIAAPILNPPAKPKKPSVAKPGRTEVKKSAVPQSTFEEPSTTKAVNQQHNDIICLDEDDEFDRYHLDSPLASINEKFTTSKPVSSYVSQNAPAVQVPISNNVNPKAAAPISKPATSSFTRSKEVVVEPEEDYNDYVYEKITLMPGDFEIVLCVDTAEVSGGGGSNKNQKEAAAKAFQDCGVVFDTRKLSVGDYLWICKPKAGSGISPDKELVLPFVIERKRLDDVVSSIKDGRFKEQKFRLKSSGLNRPIYLIEEFGNRQNLGLPEASMMQSVANTLMIEKFQVHWTNGSKDSIAFLVEMTKQCIKMYQGKTVTSRSCHENSVSDWQNRLITFKEYYVNSNKQKPLSVTQMFAKQLMQLRSVTAETATAIVKHYPTPISLFNAYEKAGSLADQLLANIEYGKPGGTKRKIGLILSSTIAMLFNKKQFDF